MRRNLRNDDKKLSSLYCNKCGKKIVVSKGIAREGNVQISCKWDYFSKKDREVHEFDLCESCYDTLIKEFVIPVEVTDEMVLI